MGKRRRNERMVLPGAAGFSKVRYCKDHNEMVKTVKVFGQGMRWQCPSGCDLHKNETVLKQRESVQRPR